MALLWKQASYEPEKLVKHNFMRRKSLITKAEFARLVGVSGAMVSKYCQRGLPQSPDGLIPLEEALQWRRDFVVPERSGNFYSRERRKELVRRVYGI